MSSSHTHSHSPKEQFRRKVILLVEDDLSNVELFDLMLHLETPYEVRAFTSGMDVIEHIEEIKGLTPALFLLDFQLQQMDALQLYDQLHKVEGLEHVPALIVSASHLQTIKDEIAYRGIRVLAKPFDLDEFIQAVQETIR